MTNNKICQGMAEYLYLNSCQCHMGFVLKKHQRYKSYILWWVENLGWRAAIKHILSRLINPFSYDKNEPLLSNTKTDSQSFNQVLGLQPGELVEVKSLKEIQATLNVNRRNKGLRWMNGMSKYCGKQYRVLKRLERIVLEDTGELRNMKNTVLLEGVMCDGKDYGKCDRSCFRFWREAWLKRVS